MKPVIRYIGGKYNYGKKLDDMGLLPEKIDTYVEPFVGGGGMMIYLSNKMDIKKYIINDVDKMLINFYRHVKRSPKDYLFVNGKKLYSKATFNRCLDTLNTGAITPATALCYFIVKNAAFNGGLYRLKNGRYSASYSSYNAMIREGISDDIKELSKILQKTSIHSKDYRKILPKNSFVFLDPPYLVKDVDRYYYHHSISLNELYIYYTQLSRNNNKVMMIMNYSEDILQVFKEFNTLIIDKKATHLNGNKKKNLKELVIMNY